MNDKREPKYPMKRIFISFDYDHDKNYRYLLSALKANPRSDIEFEDLTPEEIQSYDIGRIKAALARRIGQSDYTLVVIGEHANSYHPDRNEIGTRNWQWWEIEKSYEVGNRFIAVRINASCSTPEPLYSKGATWANSYKVESIVSAIDSA